MGWGFARFWRACGVAVALAAVGAPVSAAPAYLGAWRIVSAVTAPWADPAHPRDEAERRSLIGKTVTFTPSRIVAPGSLVCPRAHYQMTDATADLLFQGELAELASANPKRSALAMAHALGFTGASWRSLETGCEIDWHFVDPTTLEIGLNDYVYTLKKQ